MAACGAGAALLAAACGSAGSGRPGGGAGTVITAPRAALPVFPIGHAGRWLTDADGRVLLVHGMNVIDKNPPYYPSATGFSDADAAWLAANGFYVVRLGVLATGIMPSPGVIDRTYLDQVASDAAMLGRHHILVLIDLHQDGWGPVTVGDGFPAWMTLTGDAKNTRTGFPLFYVTNPAIEQAFQRFWMNASTPGGLAIRDQYAAMFGALAHAFAHTSYVLGYDLFNEPWPGTTWEPCTTGSGCAGLDHSELDPAYAAADHAIRAAGDRHLVFGEPFVLFNFGTAPTHVGLPGNDPNSGMDFHVYTLDAAHEPKVIAFALDWTRSHDGALLNTEWGATTNAADIARQAGELDRAMVPWIFWAWGEVFHDFSQAPSGANLDASTVGSLVEAYPIAVAGTPQRFSYDAGRHTMTFSWTAARAGGGSFGAGAITTFAAPLVLFPNGYRVSVTGGSVTSAPCAPLLTVAGSGAQAMSVSVAPGGHCGR